MQKPSIKKLSIIILAILLLIAGCFILLQKPQTAAADWWDDSWLYRQTVGITNSGTAETDFQVMISLDSATLITANKLQSDCDDIRITDISGKLLDYWIEPTTCNTATTKIWTKVPSISTSGDTVYLYYGNSAAASTSNKTDTLLSWTQTTDDDFNGGAATDVIVSSNSIILDVGISWVAKSAWNISDIGDYAAPKFADLDNDGDYDLLIGEAVGLCYGYENTGSSASPIWTAKPSWDIPDAGYRIAPAFADLDNDGDHDLLLLDWNGPSYGYENTGTISSPTWTAKSAWDGPSNVERGTPAFADLDNDGDFDLMMGSWGGGAYAFENTGSVSSPIWTGKSVWNGPDVGDYSSLDFADLDNDGDYDLLITTWHGMTYGYKNTGSVSSPIWTKKPSWDAPDVGQRTVPAFADLDNDGDSDLLIGNNIGISYGYENIGGYSSSSNLISSSNDTTTTSDFNNISWNGVTPAGTTIKYQIATNNDNSTWTFIGPDGTNATYYTTQEESIHSSHQGDRYIKYKAYLETTDITVTPTLNDITVFYTKYSASVSVGSPGSEERGPGPVAFWKFDEGYGQTANDSTINANNGTLGGTSEVQDSDPTWQTEDMCVSGKCLKFDGVDDYASINNIANDVTGDITISVWVKANNTHIAASSKKGTIISFHSSSGANKGIILSIGDGGNATKDNELNLWDGTTGAWEILTDTVIGDNTWHHIAYTLSGSTGTVYIDTVSKGTHTANWAYDSTDLWSIGQEWDNSTPSDFLDGFIDSVKIYPYARTAAQIKADYASRGTASGVSVAIGDEGKKSLSDGLVGYWKMDEASWDGTADEVVDSSGSGNDGVAVGATGIPTTGAGKFGNGGVFDGVDDYVEVSSYVNSPQSQMTIEFWIKTTSNSLSYVASLNRNTTNYKQVFVFQMNSAGTVTFWDYAQSAHGYSSVQTSSMAINDGNFHHVVFVKDGINGKYYIDGALDAQPIASSDVSYGASDFVIGYNLRDSGNAFNGSIDEVRIYNRALSPGEVRDLYNFAPGPVGWWKMDEKVSGNGQTINDSSGYGNMGTTSSANGTGMDCTVLGKYGGGCEFDGVDDYVDAGNGSSLNITDAITYEAWVNPQSFTHTVSQVVVSKQSITSFLLYSTTGKPSFSLAGISPGGYLISDNALELDTWSHIAMTYDKDGGTNNRKLYVNGINVKSTTDTGAITSSLNNIRIGEGFGEREFDGSIDDVRIYNYARTQAQIMEDYSGGRAQKQPIGHWKFDEGYGTTANNSGIGGSALNGTLTNMSSPATSTSGWTDLGKMGKGLVFDGGDDYADCGSGDSLDTDPITFSFWTKANRALMNNAINFILEKANGSVGSNDGYYIYFDDRDSSSRINGLGISYDRTGDSGGASWYQDNFFDSDDWVFVTVVVNSSAVNYIEVWKNGIDISPTTRNNSSGTHVASTQNLGIGRKVASAGNAFNGSIDDVKIYNYALTEDEVRKEYNQGALLKLGSTGTDSSGNPDDSQSREYCIPGDTSTCNPPVGRWDFNEGAGSTVNDISGNNNTGTWNGTGSHWTTGKIGKGGSFNGVDDYVDAGSGSSLNITQGTISMWFKAQTQTIAALYDAYVDDGNLVSIFIGDVTGDYSDESIKIYKAVSSVPVYNLNIRKGHTFYQDNQWHQLVFTMGSNFNKVYIDGFEQTLTYDVGDSSTGNVFTNFSTSSQQRIAARRYTSSLIPFNGLIDQVRIYDYARTPAQIAWDYNRGKPVAYWKFDECQGGTAYDSSGNGNDGTITIGATGTQDGIGTCTDGDTSNAWYNGRTGKYSSGMSFDGEDDYVSVPAISFLATGATLSAWVYLDSFTNAFLVGKSDSYSTYVYIIDSTHINVQTDVAGVKSFVVPTIQTGQWYFITVTRNSDTTRVYLDGIESSSGGQTQTNVLTINQIGKYAVNQEFDGLIDEVKIYNYALTAEQIKMEYNGGAVRFE